MAQYLRPDTIRFERLVLELQVLVPLTLLVANRPLAHVAKVLAVVKNVVREDVLESLARGAHELDGTSVPRVYPPWFLRSSPSLSVFALASLTDCL